MGTSPVTITPDTPQVTITPDSEKPGVFARSWEGVKRSVQGTLSAFAPPQGKDEAIVDALGPGALSTYRAIKSIPEHFKGYADVAKQTAQDISAGKGREVVAQAMTLPTLGPEAAQRARQIAQGTRPGEDLAGPIAETGTDLATLYAATEGPRFLGKAGKLFKTSAAGNIESATSDFVKAVPPTKSAPYAPSDVQAARPYLEEQHGQSPIKSVEHVRDAADGAISNIEDKIHQYIQANPQDTIRSNPIQDVKASLSQHPRGQAFVDAGLKELQDFHLDQPKTLAQADDIRRQLNYENQAVLARNNYKIAVARASDPGFAAREVAAESLRNGIYDQLDARGIEGVHDLRMDEGSLIKIRNAAQNQIFNGEKIVGSTAQQGPIRQVGRALIKAGSVGAGAAVAGPAGAIVGAGAGDVAGNLIVKEGLTKDALAARSFSKSIAQSPSYPTVPAGPQIKGLLGTGPTITPSPAPPASGTTNLPLPQMTPYVARPQLALPRGPTITPQSTAASKVEGFNAPATSQPTSEGFKKVYSSDIGPQFKGVRMGQISRVGNERWAWNGSKWYRIEP